jgi:hypothetical protein
VRSLILFSPTQIVLAARLGDVQFLSRNLLRFLGEATHGHEFRFIEKTQQAEGVTAVLSSDFPKALRIDELFEVL